MDLRGKCYLEWVKQQRKFQPYSNKINYPDPKIAVNWQGPPRDATPLELIPFGYQPKQPNPGQLNFSIYNYPFQTLDGKPLYHPGRGWQEYDATGRYYTWW